MSDALPARQELVLRALLDRTTTLQEIAAVLVVGSVARGEVDALSDLDVVVVCRDQSFDAVWSRRRVLSEGALWASDDPRGMDHGPGVHKWLTDELVLVECLIAEVHQFRLGEPFSVLAGNAGVVDTIERRDPRPAHEPSPEPLEVVRAYDDLKSAVRRAKSVRGEKRSDSL